QLLGFETPAAFILDNTMAKTPQAVYDFLKTVWEPAVKQAKVEAAELQKLLDAEGKGEKLEAWDWWFYAEKLRKAKYDLDEEELRPYFKLDNVRKGAFDLAGKLWGLKFKKLEGMPTYHADVEMFEVTDADGSLIGVLYTDYFPRPGKRAGAWMNNITEQFVKDGKNHRPIIINVGNFTKPTADKPSLLNMDEVETLFHEFGHALHGLLSQTNYISVSATNVSRDFVELPSQIMENWCFEPDVMKTYALHYETGEVIPNELIEKIQKTGTFNQGFVMTELLSASLLDMDYHMLKDTANFDVREFEKKSLERIGMIPEIIVRYRSTYFNHVFGGGYAAGYYSYTWAEVLDADAYQAFVETGDIYNKEVATAFRQNILEKGGSDDPMKLYRTFRGGDPNPEALLRKRGFIQ
nr:M3 family metallopeptidase [Paludibacter sp.]